MTDKQISAAEASVMKDMVEDDEISLIDLAVILARQKWLLISFPMFVGVMAVLYALTLTAIFTSTTKILPPQQGQSTASSMLAQLGSVAGLVGGVGGIKNPNDLYIGMLKSRTVADNLIQRFDLNKYYDAKLPSAARASLEEATNIASGKDGIITIAVDDKDPKHAADLANAYVDELYKLTKVLAVTEASKQRFFYEHQFEQAKENLAKAEVAAKRALESGGVAKVDAQGQAMIEVTARLRGQIAVKDVQIGAMRAYAAEANPDLKKAQQELAAMKSQLAKMEGAGNEGSALPADGDKGMDSMRLLRDYKYYETIYAILAKQYELAKIEEAKDASIIQVLDKAIEPDHRSRPKRAMIVLVAVLVAFFLSVLWAFIREALSKARLDPEQSDRLKKLSEALWSWRRS